LRNRNLKRDKKQKKEIFKKAEGSRCTVAEGKERRGENEAREGGNKGKKRVGPSPEKKHGFAETKN